MMKLSFMVLGLGVLAGAAEQVPAVVESPSDLAGRTMSVKTAEGSVIALVESSAAVEACGQAMLAEAKLALALAQKGIFDHRTKPEPAACAEEVVAKLTSGTKVTVLEKPEECSPRLVKVKVETGKSEGKKGCLSAKSLEEPSASPAP